MRAAYIEEIGPPENIRLGDLPRPRIGPTDVLVDVDVTTVNPVDTFVRSGLYRTPMPLPFVIGRDLVGRVAACGEGVAGFSTGDRVWCNSLGHGGRQGAAAQQATVPADRLYRLPPGVDPDDAVGVLHPAATAALALFQHAQARPGETVLVAGAAGNVGSALVRIATQAGMRVIATARAADAEYCRMLGASDVVDYRDSAVGERLGAMCPGGVDVVVDTSGVNDLTAAVDLLAFRGRIVVLSGPHAQPVLPVGSLYMKDGSVTGFAISHATIAELAEAARMINRLLARGVLRPRSVERVSLGDAVDAHLRMERGELHGKRLVMHVPS
ncbi:NADPH:quinone reductase [Actinobacteria bacterium YIM 96077]|uniref:NADPH:quinone reductase n=1 Tax=Phytoactinopolyspora halophila TaxID=1981511 RepID=A0A329QR29_9ACTN|nr:NADPH:quinone reductase [Phytoactinopolyspora halophila]AYY15732.1 NADPH:quinone reductase [Actinobacteria bacterium YIM 96077]RAW13158.1 NADPH:quinone reductase [Phytoactinopolyspora halophila]